MKKFILSVFSVALIFGFVNGPVQVGAASKTPELVEPAAVYYKNVSETRIFSNSWDAPGSIFYNAGGFSGTIYLSGSPQNTGNGWLAIYSGTVTCSGVCNIPY